MSRTAPDPEALAAALDTARALGWVDDAPLDALPRLPLGTPEQQAVLRAGLEHGDWSTWERPAEGGHRTWVHHVPWSLRIPLAVLMIRLGTPPNRLAEVLPRPDGDEIDLDLLLTGLISARGPEDARALLSAPGHPVSRRLAARLVHAMDLPVPTDRTYLGEWSDQVADTFGRGHPMLRPRPLLVPEVLRSRCADHLRAGFALGGILRFELAVAAALDADWVDRALVLEGAFGLLLAADRPVDRRLWIGVLAGPVAAEDAEYAAREDALIPLLTTGESPVVSVLAPVLVRTVEEDRLPEVAGVSLLAGAKKARLATLRALAGRPVPSAPVREELRAPLLAAASDRDAGIARAAGVIVDAWSLAATDDGEGTGPAPGDAGTGVWRETPAVWEVPRLEIPAPTPAALAAAAAELLAAGIGAHEVRTERFLAMLVAAAHQDPGATRTALRGVPDSWTLGLRGVRGWVREEAAGPLDERRRADVVSARDHAALERLGEVPCLLSTPSRVDLRVAPADLLDRLRRYRDAGLAVTDGDLMLAAYRLDLSAVTPAQLDGLAELDVPVLDAGSGEVVGDSAGAVLVEVVRTPPEEPEVRCDEHGIWRAARPRTVPALWGLGERGTRHGEDGFRYSVAVHPAWGDAVADACGTWPEPLRGAALRQSARRGAPYTPLGAAMLMSSLRGQPADTVAEGQTAMIEAFERGLLRPGVAAAGAVSPERLAALARSCLDLAEEGLASVVWPFLDGLVGAATAAPRSPAGTSDLAEAMRELAPGAARAVAEGVAPPEVLAVPGLRSLAARPGRSKAVLAARQALDLLPGPGTGPDDPSTPAPDPGGREGPVGPTFAEVWPQGAGSAPAPRDGAGVSVHRSNPAATNRMLAVDLRLPAHPGELHRVVKRWVFDLQYESRCTVLVLPEDAGPGVLGREMVLAWDGTGLSRFGSRAEAPSAGPLPVALHAVVLILAAQDGEDGRVGARLILDLADAGTLGWRGVRAAMPSLLASPDVSPGRLAGVLERNPRALPALWPVLPAAIAAAGSATGPLPRWSSRVLRASLVAAPHLEEAARRGWIPAEDAALPGLAAIADRPGSSVALRVARELRARRP